jgi:hypothetical protein
MAVSFPLAVLLFNRRWFLPRQRRLDRHESCPDRGFFFCASQVLAFLLKKAIPNKQQQCSAHSQNQALWVKSANRSPTEKLGTDPSAQNRTGNSEQDCDHNSTGVFTWHEELGEVTSD